ncbi:SHOCT domain-containing protein [Anaeroselena agilis]|uniref:SHOCT domain-containing protein n=1 Tax=Anaeroselena agilis TaxID=3063788 RepID=A0ABU3NX91_9FIRM|nr:SHOCT domain-containing protein [Selenomonadales bacterium 4137-cl]
MMLPMLLFWGLLIWGGIVLVRKLSWSSHPNRLAPESGKALEILKERYAKGEITREEFEQMKKDIQIHH